MRSAGPEISDKPAADSNRRLGALMSLKQTSEHLLLIFLIFYTFSSDPIPLGCPSTALLSSLSIFKLFITKEQIRLEIFMEEVI